MRIWFLTPTFPPVHGGSETQIYTLAAGLVRRGHQVDVLTERYPDTAEREELLGVRVHRVRTDATRWSEPDRVPWEERAFGLLGDAERVIGSGGVDILQTFCQVGALLGAMMRDGVGCPLVVTMNETTPDTDPFGASRSRLVFGQLPYDAMVVGSRAYREQAIGYGAAPGRVHLARYGIEAGLYGGADEREIQHARSWLGVVPDDPLVLLVGRYKERKGQRELVRAMAGIVARHPRARAALVGSLNSASAMYQRQLEDDIDALGLREHVLLRGSDRAFGAMRALYGAADVVVQPSHAEGLGLSAIEAVAAGRPLVAASVSGLSEVLECCPGTVPVPPRDPAALAAAVCALLDDPERAAADARRAEEAARREFTAESMVDGYLKVYERLRAASGRTAGETACVETVSP
ncbi:glycosyltransferase family 4 protein [Streptomyces sp. NPDC058257]|uniref:glycosyltransferase family 4 protein n=1 Tax=Streptomyces sp. NPDC058257 TaxID=3346409 RepID=UPI0036E97FAA